MRSIVIGCALCLTATTAFAQLSKGEAKKLNEAATVVTELRNASDAGIPEGLWDKAQCVLVIPGLKKAGFIIGGESGSGVMSCRHGGSWSAPVFMEMTKGSVGLQAGASSADLVVLAMNESGVHKLLQNKVTLGADASIAAGPVGRTASAATDAQMSAELLSYSKTKGLFAGIDLSGGTLKPDMDEMFHAYGPNITAQDVIDGKGIRRLAEARAFHDALGRQVQPTTGVK